MPTSSSPVPVLIQPSPSGISQDIQKIAFGGSAMFLASIFGNGLNYLFGIYVARNLGPYEFGLYMVGITFLSILSLIAPLGMETGSIKFISEQLGLEEREKVKSTIIQVLVIGTCSSLIFSFILAVLAGPVSLRFYQKPELTVVLQLFAMAIPLAVVSNLLISSLQAFQAFRYTALIKYIWEPLGKFILTALVFGFGFRLFGLLYVMILIFGISLVFNFMMIRKISGIHRSKLPAWSHSNLKALFVFCLPLVITNLLGVIAPRTDVLILGHWVTFQEVGFYGAAFQTAAMLTLILGSFNLIFAPIIGTTLAKKDENGLKILLQAVSRWSLILSFPIFLVLVLFGHEILSLFGKDFSQSAECLVLLASAQLFNALLGSSNTVLTMSGHSRKIMWITIISSPLLILLNIFLIPRFGILGSAIAFLLISILGGVLGVIQVWFLFRILPFKADILKIGMAGLLAFLGAFLVKGKVDLNDYGILTLLTLILIYGFVLFLFRFDEIDLFILKTLFAKIKRNATFS